jgi:hypothetical protein
MASRQAGVRRQAMSCMSHKGKKNLIPKMVQESSLSSLTDIKHNVDSQNPHQRKIDKYVSK